MKKLLAVVCCALVGACGGGSSSGDDDVGPVVPGADPTFGAGGLVTIGFPGGIGGLMRVARQDDGKVVGVGGTQESLLVMRIDADGVLDDTFGEGGVVQLPWGVATNGVTVGYGCVIQDDGAIVVAARVLGTYGALTSVGVVVRLTPDGELDPSFAGTGYVVGAPGSSALSAALQPDGKILVGAYARLERYLPDGTLDATFGTGGVSTANNLLVEDLVVQPDGAIVTVGNLSIARFDDTGAIDATFGTAGVVTVVGSSGDTLYGVALQDDGRILASGAITPAGGGTQGFWIGRFDAAGGPDATFGTGGGVSGDAAAGGVAFGVAVDGSDRIVGSGYLQLAGTAGRSARFSAGGVADATFGTGGAGALFQDVLFSNVVLDGSGGLTAAGAGFGETTTFAPVFARTGADGSTGTETKHDVGGSFDRAHAVAFQGDGKLLVGGWANGGSGAAVVRLEHDGALDTTFAEGGMITRSDNFSYVNAVVVQGSRILVGGLSGYVNDPQTFAVEAYDAAGVLDTSFGTGGVAGGLVFDGYGALGVNLATDGDAIVVVGQTQTAAGPTEYGVVKLTADGERDASFGTGGAAATAFGAGTQIATHAAIQSDGGVLVLGQSGNGPALVRFDADGTVDAGFGTVVPAGSTGMLPFGLALQSDGAILVLAGSYQTGALLIARYTSSGAPDDSFGTGGVVTRTFAGNDYYGLYSFVGLVQLDDGRLVLGLASARDDALVEDGILLRLLDDGSSDESFGPDGVVTLAIGRGSTSVNALGVDADGKLVAVGRNWTEDGGSDLMALRFE